MLRSVLVVRDNPGRRATALVTVVVDRAIGLGTMVLLALFAVYVREDRAAMLRVPLTVAVMAIVLVAVMLLSRHVRRGLRLSGILERLPFHERLHKVDDALHVYLQHPMEVALAVVLSLGNHLCATGCVMLIGHAFGDGMGYLDYLCVVSLTNTLSALPLTPNGWGLGEAAYASLFALLGASTAIGVAASVTFRLCMTLLGAVGGLWLALPSSAEMRAGVRELRPRERE